MSAADLNFLCSFSSPCVIKICEIKCRKKQVPNNTVLAQAAQWHNYDLTVTHY